MKRSSVILFFLFLVSYLVFPQSKFLNDVARDVKNDIPGSGNSGNTANSTQPEPSCACNDAQVIISMAKFNLKYQEMSIDMLEDGSFLVQDRMSNKYYLIQDGVKKGPFSEEDPQVALYSGMLDDDVNPLLIRYKEYITKTGDKYAINFKGKSYGPYGSIEEFKLTRSGDKFAAIIVENIPVTENEGEMMEAAIQNAKTEQEKMELAMKFSQQMAQKMMDGGGSESVTPKLVTNIEGASFNPMMGIMLNASMKYDDILYILRTDVIDLKGDKIITLKEEHSYLDNVFINSANSSYVAYGSGTMYFGNGKTMSDLFNPFLVKTGNRIQLSYLYYSPKNDAIMQCKIDF